MRGCSKKWEK